MQLKRPWHPLAMALASLAVGLPSVGARADGVSGTWTGDVEVRGNYYWERSTRVLAPEVGATLSSPGDVRVQGRYLVDTITSASQAVGLLTDVRFTEVRHDVSGGLGHEFDLGDTQLDLAGNLRYSTEPDYSSTGADLTSSLSLAERTTVLRLGVGFVHDEIGKILRGANRVSPDGRNLSDRGQVGTLDAVAVTAGWSQVLSPAAVMWVGYDLGVTHGFQANAYRQVVVDGVPTDERHPDDRLRHTLHGRLAYRFRETGTALHGLYRAYVDSWKIGALTPEARIYQDVGNAAVLRLRYRYYTQTRASFYRDGYESADRHVSADPKMSAFDSHLLGAQVRLRLSFLERSRLDFAYAASFDLSFEYLWNENRYGNAVISQAGVRVPF